MISNEYAKAYTEVLEIIKYFPEDEYAKIPIEKIEFYKNNMDKNYEFKINAEISLDKQNISMETNAIIVNLFRDYFATEEQKNKLKEILYLNQKKVELEKRKKYNPDEIFKSKATNKDNKLEVNSNLPIEVKRENFFKQFINYIKKLFIKNR